MKARLTKLAVEALEDRCVPSTVTDPDFNKDGFVDLVAVTSPTTITVSLANPDGSYTVSAILTAPKNQPITNVGVYDNSDGNLHISCFVIYDDGSRFYSHTWLGNGDGTFGHRITEKGKLNEW